MFERLIWLVPLVVATAGAWRPRAGLVALAAALPLFGAPPGGPYLQAFSVAALVAVLAALWPRRRGSGTDCRAPASALSWPVAAFVALSFATLVPALYLPPSWHPSILLELLRALPEAESWTALATWSAAFDLLVGWGLFLAVRRAFAGRSMQPLVVALLGGLLVTLVLGFASEGGVIDLGGYRPRHRLQSADPRMYSLFFLSGWLSQYLVIATPAALVVLGERRAWLKGAGLTLCVLSLAGIVLTQQRGAFVAALAQILIAVTIVAVRRRPRWGDVRRGLTIAVATILLIAALIALTGHPLGAVMDRARSIDSSVSPRLALWRAGAEMVAAKPANGWGLGAFAPVYDLYHPRGSENARRFRETAHNLYLHVTAERGLLGLVALLLVGVMTIRCLTRPRAGSEAMAFGLAVGLAGTAVYGLVQYVFYLKNIHWLLWILLACASLCTRPANWRTDRPAQLLVALAVLLVPIRAIAVDRPALAGDRSFGFREMEVAGEESHQWIGRFAARRLPWTNETLELSLANGHPLGPARPVAVTVGVDGAVIDRFSVPGGWQEHSIRLGEPRAESLLLTLEAEPTFRPFSDYRDHSELGVSTDIRQLGVAVRFRAPQSSR